MRIILDACVPRRYKSLLASWGHAVTRSSGHIAPDATDRAVLQLAVENAALLLTGRFGFCGYSPIF